MEVQQVKQRKIDAAACTRYERAQSNEQRHARCMHILSKGGLTRRAYGVFQGYTESEHPHVAAGPFQHSIAQGTCTVPPDAVRRDGPWQGLRYGRALEAILVTIWTGGPVVRCRGQLARIVGALHNKNHDSPRL